MRCTSLPLALLILSSVARLAQGQCGGEQPCFLLSTDAEKTAFQTFEEAELYGRCAAHCTLLVLQSDHKDLVLVNGQWRSVEITRLRRGESYKLRQCSLGCASSSSSSSTGNCVDSCFELCENCTEPYFNSICDTSHCRNRRCRTGCNLLNNIRDVVYPPPTPPLSFDASQANILAGRFSVTASVNSSQAPSADDDISSYIFQVEDGNTTSYVLHWSLTEVLDLGFFSCKTVNLSLAVVNRNGSSQFTPPISLCVHGGPPASPVNLAAESIVDDLRPGFYGHAIIGLGWEEPEGAEVLTGYELRMIPRSPFGHAGFCGSTTTFPVEKNVTKYEVRAEAPMMSLRFGVNKKTTCSYEFRIELSCSTTVDPLTGLYSTHMEFTYTNEPLVHEAIYSFVVTLRNTNISIDGGELSANREYLDSGNIVSGFFRQIIDDEAFVNFCKETAPFSVQLMNTADNITGVVTITNICPQEDIILRLRPAINDTEGPWWRPVPGREECLVSLPSVPPGPILRDSVRLLQDVPLERSLGGDGDVVMVSLSLSWDPPSEPRGEIQRYDVYTGQRLLQGTEPTSSLFMTEGNETSIDIEYTVPFNPRVCLFAQIHSLGEFEDVSNWSDPFFIPIEDGYSHRDCNFTTTSGRGESESPELLAGVISLSVILFLLLLLLISLCLLFYFRPKCCCRRKYYSEQDEVGNGGWPPPFPHTDSNGGLVEGPEGNGWEIPMEYIVREYQLGEGSFGKVAKGFIRGPVPGTYTMKDRIHASVAMKFLKDSPTKQEKQDFAQEIELMKKIGFSKHAHVVGLFGCVTVPEPVCILLEYLEYGDLLSYLQDINEAVNQMRRKGSHVEVSVVTLPATSTYTNLGDIQPDSLLSFAFQIASGMEFLAGLGVIHRDLASRNILVGDKRILKVSDFGLSREGEAYVKLSGGRLPFKWMALESLRDREFTTQSDVWAYGIVLWEIATLGEFPYPAIATEDMLSYISEGNRLEQPPNCSDEVYEQMKQCWSEQPSQRPTFKDLRETFETWLLETTNYLQFTPLTQGAPPEANAVAGKQELESSSFEAEPSQPRLWKTSESDHDLVLSNGSAEAASDSEEEEEEEEQETDV